MKRLLFLISMFTFFATPLLAQENEKPSPPSISHAEGKGQKDYDAALIAKEKGEYEKALDLLERAYFKESNALYLFGRAIILDQMGEQTLALRVLDENAEALKSHPDITNFSLVRERIANNQSKKSHAPSPSLLGPVLTGVGTASLITGIVFIIISKSAQSEAACSTLIQKDLRECENPQTRTRQEITDAYDSAKTQNVVGISLTATGLILSSLGTYLWLSEDHALTAFINPINHQYSVGIHAKW